MNCVVSCKEEVRALRPTNDNFEPSLRQQPEQLTQHTDTWLQYLFAIYYFPNRDDIIDRVSCKYEVTSAQNEDENHNICLDGGSILTQHQPQPNSLSPGLSQAHQANSFQVSLASESDRGLLIVSSDRGCLDDLVGICAYDSRPASVKKLGYIATKQIELEDKEITSIKQHYSHLSILSYSLLLFIVLSYKNALPCSGLSSFMRNDDISIVSYNYPYQSPTSPFPNVAYRLNRQRLLNLNPHEPLETLPTLMDSFSKEQTSLPQSSVAPALSSWTSSLVNPFRAEPDSLDAHVKQILVPRVSGTPGNIRVRNYIVKTLTDNGYAVELDEFTDSTPIGNVKFANIIASSDPKACRQLVLACHYDSKMMDGFLGATDSAVPCAMLLKISETFNKSFRPSEGQEQGDPKESLGLRFIFFDGEEAYVKWSQTDSLYGSRHLAKKWSLQSVPSQCTGKNELSRIELFVLLDLIGTADTSFVMYNRQLKHHYNAMQTYEKSYLARNGLTAGQVRKETAFKGRFVPLDFVEDDHVPFKQRGVPILSLLASPFPSVWHTVDDDYKAIDYPRTRRILHVLQEFVANYKKDPDA